MRYSCATSSDGSISLEFELDNHTTYNIINAIAQKLVGPTQGVGVFGLREFDCRGIDGGYVILMSSYRTTIKIHIATGDELTILAEAMRKTSGWRPEDSRRVSNEILAYLEKNNEENIANDISIFIKLEVSTVEKMAFFDIDTIDKFIREFWKNKGTDFGRLYFASSVKRKLETIEYLVENKFSEEILSAQDKLVQSLPKQIVDDYKDKDVSKLARRQIDQYLASKEISLPERIRQRL